MSGSSEWVEGWVEWWCGEQVVAPGVVVVRELIGVSDCGWGEGVDWCEWLW